MKKIRFIAGAALCALGSSAVYAQGWYYQCIDPANTMPYSSPFISSTLGNELVEASIGIAGSVTYGGSAGPCYGPSAQTLNIPGGMSFSVGPVGSVQSDFDDNMALTLGFPDPPNKFTYGEILTGGDDAANGEWFGKNGIGSSYVGASNNYWVATSSGGNNAWFCELQGRIIGDACRLQWTITNQGTASNTFGLLFGCTLGFFAQGADASGSNVAFTDVSPAGSKNENGYNGLIELPTGKPLRTQARWNASDSSFPAYVNFLFGQTANYGMHVDNSVSAATADATAANFMMIGTSGADLGPGFIFGQALSYTLPYDVSGQKNVDDILQYGTGFVQRFPVQAVAAGASRTIVHYVRQAWSQGTYLDPYTYLLDAPKLYSYTSDLNTPTTPIMTIRGIVDNQYADINKSIDMHNVRYTLVLGKGLKPDASETGQVVVDSNGLYNIIHVATLISSNARDFEDFKVISDGKTFGDIPVTLTFNPTPGPTRTISTSIRVAAGSNLTVSAGPNMVGFPYQFNDTSLDKILKKSDGTPLQTGTDYVAYTWDPDLKAYTPVQSILRGQGYWLIANSNLGTLNLNGAALAPDIANGGFLMSLKQGWNLISSPYNYPVPLNQLVGVAETNPSQALLWDQLVSAQYVQPSLAYWLPDATQAGGGSYKFTNDSSTLLDPQVAYWVFVTTTQPVRISWPPVFYESLPNSGRGVDSAFKQTPRQWRLQLSARSTVGSDTNNFVGVVSDPKLANTYRIPKPPMAPNAKLEMAVIDTFQGTQTRMAQAISSQSGSLSWKMDVKANAPGDVTVTWPNMASLPRNLRVKLTDDATGQKVDLRSNGSYTFNAAQAGTRSFTLSVDPSGSAKPVIGNVMVTRSGRAANSPIAISYSLSADALTTVRILSSTGKEIYNVIQSRADNSGDNTVTWTLHDSANRAVAPGSYQVEILAETPNGERVRRIVPVNVIR